MAFPAGNSIEGIETAPAEQKKVSKFDGPPAASPRPRSASDSSLFSSVGRTAMDQGGVGMGPEGSDPAVIGLQGLALVQRGVQMVNLAFPENPGLPAILADVLGRLQMIVPQLVAQSSNQGMGLLSNMAQMMSPMGMQPGMAPGMAPPGMGGPMGAPPMGGPAGPPMGPPGMPPGQMPPKPPMM